MSVYTIAWLFWFAWFAVVEGFALFHKDPDETLSGHVWKWFKIRDKPRQWTWRRAVLAGFLVWLLVHFVAGF